MSSKKRTHKTEKLARIYDDDILPIWGKKFGQMILRDLELPEKGQILEVSCGTGYVTAELLPQLTKATRIIAIESSSVVLDVARRKVEKLGGKGVFFRTASAEPRLSFADDVYDLVLCNLGLWEMENMPRALADFARVTYPGGQVRCTVPLAGTFAEFYDIYREVLVKHDNTAGLERLDEHLASYPTIADCEMWMAGARLGDARVDIEPFSLLFRSSREFFFAPVIEYGPLAIWKEIAGEGQVMQDTFWYIKEAIDMYFGDRAFELSVVAGCLTGTKVEVDEEDATGQVARIDPPAQQAYKPQRDYKTTTQLVDEALIESESSLATPRSRNARGEGTAEIDMTELVEILPEDDPMDNLASSLGVFVNPPDPEPLVLADSLELDALPGDDADEGFDPRSLRRPDKD